MQGGNRYLVDLLSSTDSSANCPLACPRSNSWVGVSSIHERPMSKDKDQVDTFLNVSVEVMVYLFVQLNSPMENIFTSGSSSSSLLNGEAGVS